jgi:hypothetical protein
VSRLYPCASRPGAWEPRLLFDVPNRGNVPSNDRRPAGHGTPAEVANDLLRYREAAGLDAFQINFHGNRNLDDLLPSMEGFMHEVSPAVSRKG